jgi:hypothetical protein
MGPLDSAYEWKRSDGAFWFADGGVLGDGVVETWAMV